MCTLVLASDPRQGVLLVAANRDEAYDRPSEAPRRWAGEGALWGGRDAVAGGTWLALRQAAPARIVALLNRREHAAVAGPATPRLSRGLLCLEAARARDAAEIADRLRDRLGTFPVAPFTLLVADLGSVLTLSHEDGVLSARELPPGLHAWTHGDADDPEDTRVQSMLAAARRGPSPLTLDGFATTVVPALASHAGERPVCLHGERYGTVSAVLVGLAAGGRNEFRFAPGPPCVTPFAPLPLSSRDVVADA